jgi:hypothetical protein
MKNKHSVAAIALLFVVTIAFAASSSTAQSSSGAAALHKSGVRAQVEDWAGNHPHTFTTCHLVNASNNVPMTVERVLVLGPGGRNDVLTVLDEYAEAVIAPLGELRVRIDNQTPGLPEQTNESGYGVRNVVVVWSGQADSLALSSVIIRHKAESVSDNRSAVVAQGYPILD